MILLHLGKREMDGSFQTSPPTTIFDNDDEMCVGTPPPALADVDSHLAGQTGARPKAPNVIVDQTPLQNQMEKNKECKRLMLLISLVHCEKGNIT